MTSSPQPATRKPATPQPASRPSRAVGSQIISVRSAVVLTTIVAVVVVALAVSVVVAGGAVQRDRRIDDNRATLRSDAGRIVAQVFSVNRSSWQTDRAKARDVVAGEFAASNAAVLTQPPPAGVDAVIWRPSAVGLIDVTTTRGDVLVEAVVETVARQTDSGPAGQTLTTRTAQRSVQARLELSDGRWLLTRADVLG